MSMRLFTVAEANALLPHIRPLLKQLIALQDQVGEQVEDAFTNIPDAYQNVGNPQASRLAIEFSRIEDLLNQLHALGCQLKDIKMGLIDFYGHIDGRLVNLCWQLDEPTVTFYHELDEGFHQRQPIPQ